MPKPRLLVTGATGMVGYFVAERALQLGYEVRAMVRSANEPGPLARLDIELMEADLSRTETLPPLVVDCDVVVHAAAKVGDWGAAEDYRAINVFALEHLLNAAERQKRLRRWVQISTLGVYAAQDHFGTDETVAPDVQGLDGYTRTKAEAELVIKRHIDDYHLPAVILRPGFIYGPGDRHVLPRMIARLRSGALKIIGTGQKVANNTYVGNLVDAIFLAIDNDAAVGETFNIRDQRLVTREEFIFTVADYLQVPRPKKLPLGLAKALVPLFEGFAKITRKREAPLLTRAVIKFMCQNLDYSIDKAKSKLGYRPKVDFQEGIRLALDWATGKTKLGQGEPPAMVKTAAN